MPNAVVSLFDKVLPGLHQDRDPEWPEAPAEPEDFDPLERARSSEAECSAVKDLEASWHFADRTSHGAALNPVTENERELLDSGTRRHGLEVLAFYKSRRLLQQHPFPGTWGIFYLEAGLRFLAGAIEQAHPGYNDPRKLALEMLRAHERCHFRCDVQTLLFEATLGMERYLPLRRALRGRRTNFVEEALANRDVIEWASKASVGLRDFATELLELQPGAYSRFAEPLLGLAGEWAANVVDLVPPGAAIRTDLAHWVECVPSHLTLRSMCPEYVVYVSDISRWLDPALVLPAVTRVEETDKLKKQLGKKFRHLSLKWDDTKVKLVLNRLLPGLNLKPWPKDGGDKYSVRVTDNFRAHLQDCKNGLFLAYAFGAHGAMGHG